MISSSLDRKNYLWASKEDRSSRQLCRWIWGLEERSDCSCRYGSHRSTNWLNNENKGDSLVRAYRVISGKHQHDRHGGIVSMKETISHEQGSRKKQNKTGNLPCRGTEGNKNFKKHESAINSAKDIKGDKEWKVLA